jgi:hypothetical protein
MITSAKTEIAELSTMPFGYDWFPWGTGDAIEQLNKAIVLRNLRNLAAS